ncbi:hypothetical protein [Haloarcula nitratireducens]|uniref:Uncharacterized protein n=1 Tax=Haloarcula nitratireducens TaxID=2487749 RepID=A0AAW4PH36_9EURY|nr:hypothetical protein [Halomicroarcula nitratireducens]MBX0297233.1 hypothetical protein [Halomicroarcula nitratireducens]
MATQLRRWHVLATIAILALAAVSTLLGLFRPGHYRDAPALVELSKVQDLSILTVGIPVLAIGLWYAIRGPLRGCIVWLGGLAFMTYMWLSVGVMFGSLHGGVVDEAHDVGAVQAVCAVG